MPVVANLGDALSDPHLFALEEFGVGMIAKSGHYNVMVNTQSAGSIWFSMNPATLLPNNVLMAAARTHRTKLLFKLASGNYMVQDLCFFLRNLACKSKASARRILTVQGVSDIKNNSPLPRARIRSKPCFLYRRPSRLILRYYYQAGALSNGLA